MRHRNTIFTTINWFAISIMILKITASETTNRTKLTIGGLFAIYNHPGDISSSNVQIDSVKNLEAVKWVFRLLNNKNYIDGVDLDIITEFTANSPELSSLKVGQLANQKLDESCTEQDKGQVLAIIGPETSAEAMITSSILSSVPAENRIPQVLFSTTTTLLNDTSIYKNTLRVIQADDTQVQAMISVINESEWSMVAVIFEDRVSEIHASSLFTSEVDSLSVCVAKKYKISVNEESIGTFRNIIYDAIENKINGIVYFGRSVHTSNLLTAADEILQTGEQTPMFLFSESAVTSHRMLRKNNVPHRSAKGAYVMSPPVLHIPEFRSHWLDIFSNLNSLHDYSQHNPYLIDVFENITGCRPKFNESSNCLNPTEVQLSNIIENALYTPFAIHSAFLLAKTLKMLYEKSTADDKCTHISYTDIQNELFNVNIDYREFHDLGIKLTGWENKVVRYVNGTPEKEEYFVKNFRKIKDQESCPNSEFCLVKIAEYISKPTRQFTFQHEQYRDYIDGVTEEPWANRRVVQCPVGQFCEACVPSDLSSRVLYYPGDLFVVATMSIHNKGKTPLKCSIIRNSIGFELALAIKWVIDEENRQGKLFNKKIGLLLFDTCNDPLVIQEKLIQFYRKGQKIYGADLSNRILGYVGPLGSGPTVAVANVVGKLNYIQVGCCSASSVLGDNNLFPTFLRVSTPLNRAVELMIEITKKLDANVIQIVYSEGEYGENGRDLTLKMAKDNNICVASNISVPERADNNYEWVYHELNNNANARLVFVFIRSHVAPKLATSINNVHEFQETQFRFLASDSWGNRPDNIKDNWKFLGTISIAQEMRWDKQSFEHYLSKLRPSVMKECIEKDPFLTTFFQARLNCYLPWSFDKRYSHKCSENDKLPGKNFEFDPWTPFVVNSVKVFLKGTSEAFKSICDISNTTLCYEYVSKPQKVRGIILNVKFNIDYKDGDDVIFDKYGGGVGGYVVYMADRKENMILYKKIGEKKYDQALSLDMDLVKKIIGKGGGQIPSKIDQEELHTCVGTNIYSKEKNQADQADIKLYIVSGILGVLVIVNAIYVICLVKRRRKQALSSESQPYIIPLHATG